MNIKLEKKPPQSPDLNVLDLGYFTSIQSLQQTKGCKNVDDLVGNVISSYEELAPSKLINIWVTLQLVMLEIIKVKGDNTYVLPYINKSSLEKEGFTRTEVVIDEDMKDMVECCIEGTSQKIITTYFPFLTQSHSKFLITVSEKSIIGRKCIILV